jgi:uncharacterized FAD-dependent dehydrogenase
LIRIREIALPFDHEPDALADAAAQKLNLPVVELGPITIVRKSIDARKKHRILAVYIVDVEVLDEAAVLARCTADEHIEATPDLTYAMPQYTPAENSGRPPVIVGSGPCGLFAALLLAEAGAKPILIERGKEVKARVRDVQAFWRQGLLDPESNVPFGEGGAGTFSDGKLTTQIKDKHNRVRKILTEMVAAGAPEEILCDARPHIGTDNLVRVVKNIREKILSRGGQVRFETKLTGLVVRSGCIAGAAVNNGEIIETDTLVLALGHSARDTFEMLHNCGVAMEAKPFSIGVRIEHPQTLIDKAQYGRYAGHPRLGAADYKLVHHCGRGRSAYTFCMCPGGEVIGSSSELGGIVTNGMSRYARNGSNANSALLVGITPEDFGSDEPLAGIAFQRKWEQTAFAIGGGRYFAPVQRVGDFLEKKASAAMGQITPSYTPGVTPCDLAECLPGFAVKTLSEAIVEMDSILHGFATPDAVMTAVESRSSSPLRILRDDNFQSISVKGIYPAGEGAGYAGGIISAAVDGLKIAEAICHF